MKDKENKWYPAEVACLDCGHMFLDGQHYVLDGKCISEEEYNDTYNR
jgi:hypothetical protein